MNLWRKKIKIAIFLAAPFYLSACTSITMDPPESSSLVGSCRELVQPSYLVKTSKYTQANLTSGHLIVTQQYVKNYTDDVIGFLDTGTKIKVIHVIKDLSLTESCWYVEVLIESGAFSGTRSEIPTCSMQPPTWLNSIGPLSVPSEGLKISGQFASSCASEK